MAPVGKTFRWFDALDEGDIAGDRVNDDHAGLQRAVERIETGPRSFDTGGVLVLPPGGYRISDTIEINDTTRILASGLGQTTIYPDPGVLAFRVNNEPGISRRADQTELIGHSMASQFEGFTIAGTSQGQRGFEFVGGNDHIGMRDVWFWTLAQAMDIAVADGAGRGWVREASFFGVRISHCGDGLTPALRIGQDGQVAAGDGVNHLTFHDLAIVYPKGIGMLISDTSSEVVRRIDFHKFMLHGPRSLDIGGGQLGSGQDVAIIEGAASDIQMHGLMTNGSEAGKACIRFRVAPGVPGPPRNISIQGSVSTSDGDGIVVEQAQGINLDLLQSGPVSGDLVRFEANSLPGGRFARVDVQSSTLPTAPVNIDPTVAGQVKGWLQPGVFTP